MFFGKLFKKDHRHYLTQGTKCLAAERYADARVDFLEALNRCPAEATQDEQDIRKGLDQAGNRLGEMNLQEGEHSLNAGDLAKARDHFVLAGELAVDETIRAMAGAGLKKLQQPAQAPAARPAAPAHKAHGGSSCGSCKDTGSHSLAEDDAEGANLSEDDRFFLMVQPLPGELSGRYATLGGRFKEAYLMIHDGNDANAFPILQEMLVSDENDIVIYEVALIMYRAGRVHECEALLNRSLLINPGNSMSYLALVHLTAEAQRYPEALSIVKRMMELGILADQAQFMLGELLEASGDQAGAFEAWTKALELPSMARSAAERLIPLLNDEGRTEEAKYLAKRYLKGCC
jgi:tetratricopeptide (TPR) repeat protein